VITASGDEEWNALPFSSSTVAGEHVWDQPN